MINIKHIVEMKKGDTVLRYSEGDNVICVTMDGRLYIGTIEIIGSYEGKEAIRLNTSDVKNTYKYTSVVLFLDDIECIAEENDTNTEVITNLLWGQYKEDFINIFAELGFDIGRIEQLYDKAKQIVIANNVVMGDLVKSLVYSVENYIGFKEYLLGNINV